MTSRCLAKLKELDEKANEVFEYYQPFLGKPLTVGAGPGNSGAKVATCKKHRFIETLQRKPEPSWLFRLPNDGVKTENNEHKNVVKNHFNSGESGAEEVPSDCSVDESKIRETTVQKPPVKKCIKRSKKQIKKPTIQTSSNPNDGGDVSLEALEGYLNEVMSAANDGATEGSKSEWQRLREHLQLLPFLPSTRKHWDSMLEHERRKYIEQAILHGGASGMLN
eukprot:Colp12_sorted_trinity150504_noHs@35969